MKINIKLQLYLVIAISVFIYLTAATQNSLAFSQTQSPESVSITIEDFDWIAGNWQGEAMGGKFEETWNRSNGGAMMGMFKFIDGDKIAFYEILTILPQDKTFVLRLKHFDGELKGWEEKDKFVEFPLVSVSSTEAKFDGLTFTKLSKNRIDIAVVTKDGDKVEELKFECHRADSKSNVSSAPAIRQIFAIDQVLAKQRDKLPETQTIAHAVESYVTGLDSLDFSKCPTEFAVAFKAHRNAWNDSKAFFKKHDSLRGEMHSSISEIRKLGDQNNAELDSHLGPILKTWEAVEKAAAKFGVK